MNTKLLPITHNDLGDIVGTAMKIGNEHFMKHYYPKTSAELQEAAWKSLMIWFKNPLGDAGGNAELSKTIINPLLNTSYFCPVSDKDIIMKMFASVSKHSPDKCFVMVRLSQNERPLVWVCAFGGSTRIVRVRIGIPTENNRNYTIVFKNQETDEVEITYSSESLQVIMAHLHIHYAPKLKIYEWFHAF